MSIVDSTLQQLGSAGQTPDQTAAAPTPNLNSFQQDLLFIAGPKKQRKPIALWLGLLTIGVGAAAYLYLPQVDTGAAARQIPLQANGTHQAPAQSAAPVPPPPAAVAPVSQLPQAQEVIAAPSKPAEAAPSPLATAADTRPASAEPPVQPAPNAVAPVPVPVWIQEGKKLADQGRWPEAFDAWEAGLRAIPDNQSLIAGHSFTLLHDATKVLHRGTPEWSSFVFQQLVGGKLTYRAVVLPPAGEEMNLRQIVADSLGRADLVKAAYLKARIAPAAAKGIQQSAPASAESIAKPAMVPAHTATVEEEQKPAAVQTRPQAAVEPANSRPPKEEARRNWEQQSASVKDALRQESFGAAIDGAEALTREFPNRWEPWYWLGTARLATGNLSAAEAALDRAVQQNPKVVQIWVQRAVAAQERSDHQGAVRYLNEALNLSPKTPEIHLNLGFSNDALGRQADAERYFRSFLSLTEGLSAYATQRQFVLDRLSRH